MTRHRASSRVLGTRLAVSSSLAIATSLAIVGTSARAQSFQGTPNPVVAGSRELAEETGCALRHARLLMVGEDALWGATNRVHYIAGHAHGTPRADGREIMELRFCAPADLPTHLAVRIGALTCEWLKTEPVDGPD